MPRQASPAAACRSCRTLGLARVGEHFGLGRGGAEFARCRDAASHRCAFACASRFPQVFPWVGGARLKGVGGRGVLARRRAQALSRAQPRCQCPRSRAGVRSQRFACRGHGPGPGHAGVPPEASEGGRRASCSCRPFPTTPRADCLYRRSRRHPNLRSCRDLLRGTAAEIRHGIVRTKNVCAVPQGDEGRPGSPYPHLRRR